METMTFCVPCLFGLEGLVGDELRRLELSNVRVEDRRVFFEGDFAAMAKANLCCRMGERVMILLSEFDAHSFEDLFQGVKATPLERFIPKDGAFPVKGYSLNSQLHSVPDCQAIVKKAAVTRLGEKYGLGWMPETGETYQLRFSIMKDHVELFLDTSGVSLHKRGYRREAAARDDGGRHGESGPVPRAGFLLGSVLRLGDHLHRGGDDRAEPRAGAEPVVHGPEMVLRARDRLAAG